MQKILMASQTLDLCFAIDGTGSMGPAMKGVVSTVRSIIGELQDGQKHLKFNLGLVVYRDVGDGDQRFAVYPFDGSISGFEKFLDNQTPTGGADQCEDVLGGLDQVTKLDWQFQNRVLILIADAPCHGDQYHNGCGDDYPSGSFPGSKEAGQVVSALQQSGVDFTFLKINPTTDKMIAKFNELGGGQWITTMDINEARLDDKHPTFADALKKTIKDSVKDSLNRTFAASASAAGSAMKDRTFTALDAVGSKLATIPEKSGRGSDSASSSKPSASGSSGGDGSVHSAIYIS